MKYPKEYLDEIKARLKVSTVVSKYLTLKQRGKEFVGLSPFKNEKTPSFTVNDEKGFYHCFSTAEHGNIFDFLMKTQNLKFGEAVRMLANLAGMTPYRFSKLDEQREKEWIEYTEIYNDYIDFHHQEIFKIKKNSNQLNQYLKERGLNDEIIKNFKIGFSNFKSGIYENLKSKFGENSLKETGLFFHDEKNLSYVDRFRNRIIFPINSLSGKPIAIGGRTLDTSNKYAKYINSPETNFFKKGNNLYNLDRARKVSNKHDDVFLVEGYMDVVSLTKLKIENCVANLGTALTEKQIFILSQFFKQIIICFDSDESGYKAAIRAAENSIRTLEPEKQINFLFLPKNEDPDSFVKKNGKKFFLDYSNQNQIPIHKFLFQHYKNNTSSTPSSIAALEKKLRAISATIKDSIVKKYVLGFFVEQLASFAPSFAYKKKGNNFTMRKSLDITKKIFQEKEQISSIQIKEFSLLYIILKNLDFFYQRKDLIEDVKIFNKENKMIFLELKEKLSEGNLKELQIDNQLLIQIDKHATIKHLIKENDKDEAKIVEFINEIKQDLKTHSLELRIQELESKFAQDFSQNTFDEIRKLKKEQNIN